MKTAGTCLRRLLKLCAQLVGHTERIGLLLVSVSHRLSIVDIRMNHGKESFWYLIDIHILWVLNRVHINNR